MAKIIAISKTIPNDWFSEDEIYHWKNSQDVVHFFEALKSSLQDGQKIEDVTILHLPSSKGFAIHPRAFDYPVLFWKKLMFYWKNDLLGQDYVLHNRNIREEGDHQFFRFYLKPSIRLKLEKPINQLYGNILMELNANTSKATLFKMQVNQYNDRIYAPAKEVSKLYERLCH